MSAMLHDLLVCLTIACGIPAGLGILEAILAHIQRERAYRGLPEYDSPDARVRRAMAAYRAASSYRGLR